MRADGCQRLWRPVHAFASLSIRQTPGGYLAYLGVFVKPEHRFTMLYMGAIAPFRRLVVYPAIIRKVQRAWAERYGGESGVASREIWSRVVDCPERHPRTDRRAQEFRAD